MDNQHKAVEITDSNFEEIISNGTPVVVDFWAEWCGPCRQVGPVIDELANVYDGKAIVGKVNVDNNPQIAMKYGIRSIPTILFFKDGEIKNKQVGAATLATFSEKLDDLLKIENPQ
jgi:thioredoxin 1